MWSLASHASETSSEDATGGGDPKRASAALQDAADGESLLAAATLLALPGRETHHW